MTGTVICDDLLHIGLITFNRAAKLERTLDALAKSCFKDFPFTIYDNASTDHTPTIIEKYRGYFSKLRVIRHPRNIGVDGNAMRAYSDAGGRFFWLLCDDDLLHPEYSAEIVAELQRDETDLVCINAIGLEGFEPGYRGRLNDMAQRNWRFFWLGAFVPSTIYRTSLITSKILQQMILHCGQYYFHAILMAGCVEANCRVFIANPGFMEREPSNDIGTDWVAYTYGWLRSLEDCTEVKTRHMAFWHRFGPAENWWLITLKSAAYMLAFKNEKRTNVLQMWLNLPGGARLFCVPILGFLCLPRLVLRSIGKRLKTGAGQSAGR